MSDMYLKGKVYELLGGKDKFSPEFRGNHWSPNEFKWIALLNGKFIACKHGSNEITEVDVIPEFAEEGIDPALSVLSERAFGTLEGVILSETFFSQLGTRFNSFLEEYSARRLYFVGQVKNDVESLDHTLSNVSIKDLSTSSNPSFPGYNGKDWWNRFKLLPEAYPLDETLRGYFEEQAALHEPVSEAHEEEEIAEEEEEGLEHNKEFKRKVLKNFMPTIRGTVKDILEEYSKIFASGYEVLSPYGILAPDSRNVGVALRLSGSSLKAEDYDRTIQNLWKVIQERMGLTVCENRSVVEISRLITTGFANKEEMESGKAPISGNLYFPNKMLEYAFGRRKPKPTEGSVGAYPPHASSTSWSKYAKDEVTPSLEDVIKGVVWDTLHSEGLLETYYEDSSFERVKSNIEKLKRALCTCVLVSKHEVLKDEPITLKVRVLDPYGNMPVDQNLATQAIVATMTTDGGASANSARPEKDGIFYEYTHEVNHQLANAEPLFAFKALKALKEQGTLPNWNNLILGIDVGDNILRAGEGGIDFTQNLTHCNIAGSRAGKGVWSLNLLAAGINSSKAIFYNDDKPDMGSLLLSLNPDSYVVNGADYTYSPADGTDYFGTMKNRNADINPAHVPGYLSDLFSSFKYDDLGAVIYMRSVLLCMSILAARVKNMQWYDQLGGSNGVLIFFDELSNANSQFSTFFTKNIQKHLANTSYAEDSKTYKKEMQEYVDALAEWESSGKAGARPNKPSPVAADKPSRSDYWFTALYEALEESVETLYELSNAGLKNTEAKVSDVFVLAQSIPEPISSLAEKGDLFTKRNKASTGRGSAPKNPNILPSLAMVGGVDAFLGYNKENGRILNQGTPGSYASDKLDKNARNFAYVPNFMAEGRARVLSGDESFARQAVYFKPFLIFPEGSKENGSGEETSYFVRNARQYAEKSGLLWEDVVARNESEKNPGKLDSAIGFKEYLREMGVSDEDVQSTLSLASQIAQFVVDKMGYPGTWKEFIHDMRPEWIFSVNDIVNSLDGETFSEKPTAKLKEFLTVYPEDFPQFSGHDQDTVSKGVGGYFDSNGFADLEDEAASSEQEEEDSSPVQVNPALAYGFQDEVASAPVEEPDFPEGTPLSEPNWTGGPTGIPVPPPSAAGIPFSATGEYVGEDAEVFNHWDPNASAIPVTPDNTEFSGTQGLADVMNAVTTAVLQRISADRIERAAVLGGALLINSTPVAIRLPESFLVTVPEQIRRELNNQLLAGYFNWGLLYNCPNLVALNFDSSEYVVDRVLEDLGLGVDGQLPSYGGVPFFFENIPSLRNLRIAGEHFSRKNYKKKLSEDSDSPAVLELESAGRGAQVMSKVDDFLGKSTRGSFNYTRNVVKRKDYGMARKILLGTAGVAGAAALGTLAVGSKVTQGAFRGLKSVFNAIGEAVHER